MFLGKGHDFPTLADGGKEFARVEVAPFLGRFCLWDQKLSPGPELHLQISCQNRDHGNCLLLLTLAKTLVELRFISESERS